MPAAWLIVPSIDLPWSGGATATGFDGRQECMGVRGVCVRMFFQPAQSNFGKSEAIS